MVSGVGGGLGIGHLDRLCWLLGEQFGSIYQGLKSIHPLAQQVLFRESASRNKCLCFCQPAPWGTVCIRSQTGKLDGIYVSKYPHHEILLSVTKYPHHEILLNVTKYPHCGLFLSLTKYPHHEILLNVTKYPHCGLFQSITKYLCCGIFYHKRRYVSCPTMKKPGGTSNAHH